MSDKTWKKIERKVANKLGGKRNPLSGRNSMHGTSADVLFDDWKDKFYVEVKHKKAFSVYTIFETVEEQAKKENKIPILIIHMKGKHKYLAMINLDLLSHLIDEDD